MGSWARLPAPSRRRNRPIAYHGPPRPSLSTVAWNVVSLSDFAPLPERSVGSDVLVDATEALGEAIAVAAALQPLPGTRTGRGFAAVGTTIVLPALPAGRAYAVDDTVELPATKNLLLRCESPRGVRIRSLDVGRPIFRSGGPAGPETRAHGFENLVFHGGGVALAAGAAGRTTFRACSFHDVVGWCIATEGPGVSGVRIEDCEFADCPGGGVLVGHSGCEQWLIGDNCWFSLLGGVGVEVRSAAVTVRECRFEAKRRGARAQPHILVGSSLDTVDGVTPVFAGGYARITGCHFSGDVVPGSGGPPSYCIELTPTAPAVAVTGVQIDANRFLGLTDGPDRDDDPAPAAVAAIRTPRRVHLCSVSDNYVRRFEYLRGVLDDALDPALGPAGGAALGPPGVNTFHGNGVHFSSASKPRNAHVVATKADLFTAGGIGWHVWPE